MERASTKVEALILRFGLDASHWNALRCVVNLMDPKVASQNVNTARAPCQGGLGVGILRADPETALEALKTGSGPGSAPKANRSVRSV
jgi:hypothetical protein